MATMQRMVEHFRSVLVRDGAGLTDTKLLERFIDLHEEGAFEAIVRRHGPMVLSVCRRLLRNSHDAEDAFQATFLVLARKASTIRSKDLVSNWLYGVAYQTARKAMVLAAKRHAREKQMNEIPEPEAVRHDSGQDWQHLLDQALHALPDKYRMPTILCELEGKTRKEAAQELGIREGTLSSRLARARTMLAKRLARHGIVLSGVAATTILSQNAASACVPATLLGATAKAAAEMMGQKTTAASVVSAKVANLTDHMLKSMLWTKVKTAAALFLLTGIITFGAVLFTCYMPVAEGKQAQNGGQRAQVGGQKAEDGGRKTEVGGQKTEDRQKTEDGGQDGQKTEDGRQRTEAGEASTPLRPPPSVPPFVIRVACGSDKDYTDLSGVAWSADQKYSKGKWGYSNGQKAFRNGTFPTSNAPLLYVHERYGVDNYRFDVPTGKYTVRIHLCETWDGSSKPGQRIFGVKVQDNQTLKDFDLAREVGFRKPYIHEVKDVEVTDGKLMVHFQGEHTLVNAIEVIGQ